MALFTTVAVVCTMAICNDYMIDKADTLESGVINTQSHADTFDGIWQEEKPLTEWLTKQKIGETVFEIVSVEFETQEVQEVDIP